jgi:hypothetical protein
MGAETSIDSLNSSKIQSSPNIRSKLNFSGIKDYSKTQFFSCLCNQADPSLSKERSSVFSSKAKRPSQNRRHSSTIFPVPSKPEGSTGFSETTETISKTLTHKQISSKAQTLKVVNFPKQNNRFPLKNSSILESSSSLSSVESQNQSSSKLNMSESSLSLNESQSFKDIKKSLEVSSSLLYDIDDLDEDFPFEKETFLVGEGEKFYKGETLNGEPHGYGIETCPDGSRYEGTYLKGVREGQGIYVWPDKSCYKGSFKNGFMAGFGIFQWPTGNKYEGMWKESKMHGEGKYTWNNGNTYSGGYCEGLKHGEGVFQYSNGKNIKARWIRGCIQLNV